MKRASSFILITAFTSTVFAHTVDATSLDVYRSLPPIFSDTLKTGNAPSLPYKEAPPAYDTPSISLPEAPPSHTSLFPNDDDASFDNEPMSIINIKETPRYQAEEALRLCDMSYKTGETWSEFVTQEQTRDFEIKSFAASYEERSGFVRVHPDGRCDVVFKGTKNIANVLTDLWANWAVDPESGLRTHNGFMKHAKAVMPEILSILRSVAHKKNVNLDSLSVFVFGHSLGAGTILAAAKDLEKHLTIKNIALLGSPKGVDVVSKEELNDLFGYKVDNFVQERDIVTFFGGLSLLRVAISSIQPWLWISTLLCSESEHVGNIIVVPGGGHKLSSYKTSIEQLDQEGSQYTFAPRLDSKPKKYLKKIMSIPSRIEHYAHKGFSNVKRFLMGSWS